MQLCALVNFLAGLVQVILTVTADFASPILHTIRGSRINPCSKQCKEVIWDPFGLQVDLVGLQGPVIQCKLKVRVAATRSNAKHPRCRGSGGLVIAGEGFRGFRLRISELEAS